MSSLHKTLSILLLLVYSSFVFRIIFPVLDYVINYDYIVTELCIEKDIENNSCQGSCHLSEQIQKQIDSENSDKKIVPLEFLKIPHLFTNSENSNICLLKNITDLNFIEKEITILHKPLLPPPKFI